MLRTFFFKQGVVAPSPVLPFLAVTAKPFNLLHLPTATHPRHVLETNPFENLLEIVLIPPDLRLQPRKLPDPINLAKKVLVRPVAVTAPIDPLKRQVCEAIVSRL